MAFARLKKESVAQAIIEFSGNTAAVARKFGVTRQAVQQFIKKNNELRDASLEARQTMIDNVESALYQAALDGESWAVCFFLKTQAKDRGYVERAELTGADGGSIEVSVFEKHVLKSYGELNEQAVDPTG